MKCFILALAFLVVGCRTKYQTLPEPKPELKTGLIPASDEYAREKIQGTYVGTWIATNRPLEGKMRCVVTELDNKWTGTFDGIWQGVPFKYNIDWVGMPDALKGKANIDLTDYEWTGEITDTYFKGTFCGTRYEGRFELRKEVLRER